MVGNLHKELDRPFIDFLAFLHNTRQDFTQKSLGSWSPATIPVLSLVFCGSGFNIAMSQSQLHCDRHRSVVAFSYGSGLLIIYVTERHYVVTYRAFFRFAQR